MSWQEETVSSCLLGTRTGWNLFWEQSKIGIDRWSLLYAAAVAAKYLCLAFLMNNWNATIVDMWVTLTKLCVTFTDREESHLWTNIERKKKIGSEFSADATICLHFSALAWKIKDKNKITGLSRDSFNEFHQTPAEFYSFACIRHLSIHFGACQLRKNVSF